MVPSIGFEPMTFPMSRERATPAPTGLKLIYSRNFYDEKTAFCLSLFCLFFACCKIRFTKNLQAPKNLQICFFIYYSII